MNDLSDWIELFNRIVAKPEHAGMSISIVSGLSLIVLYLWVRKMGSSSDNIVSGVLKKLFFWMTWIFLFGVALMLTGKISSWATKGEQETRLESLTTAKIEILDQFIVKKKLTGCFPNRDLNTLDVLERDGIVYKLRSGSGYACYGIENWAYNYLLERPGLLKPTT